jgi:hypothetical protein
LSQLKHFNVHPVVVGRRETSIQKHQATMGIFGQHWMSTRFGGLENVPLLHGLPSSSAKRHNEHHFKIRWATMESLGNIGRQHASIALKTVPLLDGLPPSSAQLHNDCRFKNR